VGEAQHRPQLHRADILVRTAPSAVHWPLVRDAVAVLANKLAIAEARLADSGFLCGEQLMLADIQFGHVLFCYFDIPIERPQLPNLRRYYEQLTMRAAFREHVMVSYAELAVA
jgi:glutathione S-transferase